MCIGDFNEILVQDEKEGGAMRRERQMDGFRGALEDCRLSDLGYQGYKFTWNNGHQDDTFANERLEGLWLIWNGGNGFKRLESLLWRPEHQITILSMYVVVTLLLNFLNFNVHLNLRIDGL
jgi:hypothetical protein